MPRIFDNIEQQLLPALRQALDSARRADFCVGYFNLRGWKQLDDAVQRWAGGEGQCCRLLVGMQRLPQEDLRDALRIGPADDEMYLQKAAALRRRLAEEFREQLTMGAPTDGIGKGGRETQRQSVFASPDPFFPPFFPLVSFFSPTARHSSTPRGTSPTLACKSLLSFLSWPRLVYNPSTSPLAPPVPANP